MLNHDFLYPSLDVLAQQILLFRPCVGFRHTDLRVISVMVRCVVENKSHLIFES